MSSETMISLDISLAHPGFRLALREQLPLAGVTAIFGPSGAGKTSLLRVIAGLEPKATGRLSVGAQVWMEGARATPPHQRRVGYVFQDGRLFGHLSVHDNLRYGKKRRGGGADEAEVLRVLDLGGLLGRSIRELSGGERQRVALARCLLSGPELMLLDEPLTALDEERKSEVMPYLERVVREFGCPALLVTHNRAEVQRLADRVLVLAKGESKGLHEVASTGWGGSRGPQLTGIVIRSEGGRVEVEVGGQRVTVSGTQEVGAEVQLRIDEGAATEIRHKIK